MLRVLLHTFDVWSLHIPCCNILQLSTNDKSRKERGRKVCPAGHEHEAYTWWVGELACLKKTCFCSIWQHTFLSSFYLYSPCAHFKESEFVYRRGHGLSQGYWPGCTLWAPLHHLWLNMSGHLKVKQGGKLFYPSYLFLNTHIHMNAFIHINTHTCLGTRMQHTNTRPQWRSWTWIRMRMRGNSTHTFLHKHAIASHVLCMQSIRVCRGMFMQARSEMAIFQQARVHSDVSYRPCAFARPVINFTCQNVHPENSSLKCKCDITLINTRLNGRYKSVLH